MINGFNQKEINLDLKGFPLYRVTTGKNIFVKNFSSFNINFKKICYYYSVIVSSRGNYFVFMILVLVYGTKYSKMDQVKFVKGSL